MVGVALLVVGAVLVAYMVLLAAAAGAQPAPGDAVTVTNGSDAGNDATVIDSGDVLTVSGNYEVQAGASITVEDGDGTQGTFTDGVNATITANGELTITVTGDPTAVSGGDGTLGVEGVTVVSTTGVSDATDVDVTDVDVTDVDVTDDATDDQYGDDVADDTVDDDVADDASDVLDDTVPDKPLPNTGGMPLSVLIVGFALVCGGSVILRSGIRRKE